MKLILYILSLIPLVTGINSFLFGLEIFQNYGTTMHHTQLHDPLLNSQIRFWGAIWFGFGLLLLYFITFIKKYINFIRAFIMIGILGGIGRCISLYQFGLPSETVTSIILTLAIFIEIFILPIILYVTFKIKNYY